MVKGLSIGGVMALVIGGAGASIPEVALLTAIDSLTMVFLYAPLSMFLLGVSGIIVPWKTIALSVTIYIATPLIAGYITRSEAIKRKGADWFESKLIPPLGRMSIIALLITLVVLFTYQGYLPISYSSL